MVQVATQIHDLIPICIYDMKFYIYSEARELRILFEDRDGDGDLLKTVWIQH